VREIPWFELARDVTVYDTRPAATFGDLKLPGPASVSKVVSAVHACFPSLEPELLTPDVLPRRVQALVESDDMATRVMPVIARQLGWWAAAVALLLIPPALVARSPAGTRLEPDIGNAWPLSMFFLAAAVGGWTLTVVGSCVLAPVEQ
jgi:hypothetical protein